MSEWLTVLILVGISYLLFAGAVDILFSANSKNRKLINSLKSMPQSGFWICCQLHGNVPLSKSVYDDFIAKSKFRCPVCDAVPIKIWKTY